MGLTTREALFCCFGTFLLFFVALVLNVSLGAHVRRQKLEVKTVHDEIQWLDQCGGRVLEVRVGVGGEISLVKIESKEGTSFWPVGDTSHCQIGKNVKIGVTSWKDAHGAPTNASVFRVIVLPNEVEKE